MTKGALTLEALTSRKIKTSLALLSGTLALASGTAKAESPDAYHVRGTYTDGVGSVNERSAPSVHAKKLGELAEGAAVHIICQERGGVVKTEGRQDTMWDKISAPAKPNHIAYVTDFYIDTPRFNQFSPGIPKCN